MNYQPITRTIAPKCAILLSIIIVAMLTPACAQSLKLIKEHNQFHQTYEFQTKRNKVHKLQFKDSFTSVVFELKKQGNFNGVVVIAQNDTIDVKRSQHSNAKGKQVMKSSLIMMPGKTNTFKLLTKNKRQAFIIHLLNASTKGSIQRDHRLKKTEGKCSRPSTVPQSEWREGLQEPDYDPINHDVRHVIIHHSAGNTNNADTRSVVRNIYLHHTQVNGWSDIGYNFVVGINGKIFEGRDAMGQFPDHRVKGAHFCGKNSNTMGIALIGNYQNTEPHQPALNSLKKLLAWKMNLERLDPFAYYKHPEYDNNPDFLGTVSGHRDGCATACPGNKVYTKIEGFKESTRSTLEQCRHSTFAGNSGKKQDVSIRYSQGQISISGKIPNGKSNLSIYDLQGRKVRSSENRSFGNTPFRYDIDKRLNAGIYMVQIASADGRSFSGKIYVP